MRICVVGSGPWPLEKKASVTGPSIRLRQFVEPLIEVGHKVTLVLLEEARRDKVAIAGAASAMAFPPEEITSPATVAAAVNLEGTEAVLGVGSLMPAVAAARLATLLDCPCWTDYFGDPLAELHAVQSRHSDSVELPPRDHVWKYVRETLLRGDRFSTVSGPQRHALLGQLEILGRCGALPDVSSRLHVIPCAVPESWTAETPPPPFPEILQQHGLEPGASYLYFGGSWNVWLDEVAMAASVSKTLEEQSDLRVVVAGIPTGSEGNRVRDRFFEILKASQKENRVIELAEWTREEEEALLCHAATAVCLDRPIPESELGSRNRLLAMVRWGTHPVVTLTAELERELHSEGLVSGVETPDPDRVSHLILQVADRSPEARKQDRQRGVQWLRGLTFRKTLEPVLGWIADGTPRWTREQSEGLIDRWAAFPDTPEALFPPPRKRRFFPF